MPRLVLLAAALLFSAAPAAAQGWGGSWEVECNRHPSGITQAPATAEGSPAETWPYRLVSQDDGCTWDRMTAAGSETVRVTAEQVQALTQDLDAISRHLDREGFREPILAKSSGTWRVLLYPGDFPCLARQVCTQGTTTVDGTTVPVGSYGEYLVVGSGNRLSVGTSYFGDTNGRVTAAHELMHAVQAAYTEFFSTRTSSNCKRECWIGEGVAEGFGQWWVSQSGGARFPYVARRYDDEIRVVDDQTKGQDTAGFWRSVADERGGFGYLHDLYRAGPFEGSRSVANVDRGLRASGHPVHGGLAPLYRAFAAGPLSRTANELPAFDQVPTLRVPIPARDRESRRAVGVTDAQALATYATTVTFSEPDRLMRLELHLHKTGDVDAPPPPSTRLIVNGLLLEDYEWNGSTADFCHNGECEARVRVPNIADEAGDTHPVNYTLSASLVDGCAFALPRDVTGLAYVTTGPGREDRSSSVVQSRVTYDFKPAPGQRARPEGDVEALVVVLGESYDVVAKMECSPTGFSVRGLASGGVLPDEGIGMSAVAAGAPTPTLPSNPRPGDTLDPVSSEVTLGGGVIGPRGAGGQGGAGMTIRTRISNLVVEGRSSVDIPTVGRISTWKIVGTSTQDGQLESGMLTTVMEEMGVDVDEVEVPTGIMAEMMEAAGLSGGSGDGTLRGALRDLMGAASNEIRTTSSDFEAHYSPAYGLVKMTIESPEPGVAPIMMRLTSVIRR